jgi:hypothetical protein
VTKLEEAQAFLTAALAGGARPGDEVTREASAKGIALQALMKARESLHITPRKVDAAWVWEMPGDGELSVDVDIDL